MIKRTNTAGYQEFFLKTETESELGDHRWVCGCLAHGVDRQITLALNMMKQAAQETPGLEREVGLRRVTAAGRRVLEADLGIMDSLEGGEVVRMIGWGKLLATEI